MVFGERAFGGAVVAVEVGGGAQWGHWGITSTGCWGENKGGVIPIKYRAGVCMRVCGVPFSSNSLQHPCCSHTKALIDTTDLGQWV